MLNADVDSNIVAHQAQETMITLGHLNKRLQSYIPIVQCADIRKEHIARIYNNDNVT